MTSAILRWPILILVCREESWDLGLIPQIQDRATMKGGRKFCKGQATVEFCLCLDQNRSLTRNFPSLSKMP